jgi:flagellar biosynthesis regulator FlaF
MANTLGEELSASLTSITALILKTESKSERTRLTRQQAQIAGQLQVFVDQVVDESLAEYRAASNALNAANAEAQKAKANLDRVAATIKKFAAAIDKLAALAAKVAAA